MARALKRLCFEAESFPDHPWLGFCPLSGALDHDHFPCPNRPIDGGFSYRLPKPAVEARRWLLKDQPLGTMGIRPSTGLDLTEEFQESHPGRLEGEVSRIDRVGFH